MEKWMKEYLIDTKKLRKEETASKFYCIRNNKIDLAEKHYGFGFSGWKQIEYQCDLLKDYFNITTDYSCSNRYKYYRCYLDVDDYLPEFFSIEILNSDRSACILHVNNILEYAKAINRMNLEYLNWCKDNHLYCGKAFILPPGGGAGSLMLPTK